ncbi:MAG: hypothetical protein J5850_00875, partial [Clostridia bacterium]|nr:hypothetical protein [Clostridia bacterium]
MPKTANNTKITKNETGTPAAKSETKKQGKKKSKELLPENPSSLKNQLIIVAFVIAAILLIVFMVLTNTSYKGDSHSGPIGFYLCRAIYGFMGSAAYLLPLVLIYLAVIWHRSKKNHTTLAKIISAICFVILVSSICYLATRSGLTNKIAAEH